MEDLVERGHILAGQTAEGLHLGLQNVGVGFILVPEETIEFIVVAFLGSGEGPVKSESLSVRWSENKCGRRSGVRATQLESLHMASNCVRMSSVSVRPVKEGGKRHEELGTGAGAVIVNITEWF